MGNAISYGWILDIFFLLFSVLTILIARKKVLSYHFWILQLSS